MQGGVHASSRAADGTVDSRTTGAQVAGAQLAGVEGHRRGVIRRASQRGDARDGRIAVSLRR
jgi:hypothetical protein